MCAQPRVYSTLIKPEIRDWSLIMHVSRGPLITSRKEIDVFKSNAKLGGVCFFYCKVADTKASQGQDLDHNIYTHVPSYVGDAFHPFLLP